MRLALNGRAASGFPLQRLPWVRSWPGPSARGSAARYPNGRQAVGRGHCAGCRRSRLVGRPAEEGLAVDQAAHGISSGVGRFHAPTTTDLATDGALVIAADRGCGSAKVERVRPSSFRAKLNYLPRRRKRAIPVWGHSGLSVGCKDVGTRDKRGMTGGWRPANFNAATRGRRSAGNYQHRHGRARPGYDGRDRSSRMPRR